MICGLLTFLIMPGEAQAGITYDGPSDTITIVDGTYSFDDIQTANDGGGWGQMTTQGNQHKIDAKIVVGDGSTTTALEDTKKHIEYSGDRFFVRIAASIKLGLKDANDHVHDGCSLYAPNITGTYMFGYNTPASAVESGDLYLYGSNVYVPGFWAWYRDSDQVVEIIGCNVTGWGRIQGTNSILKDTYNHDGHSSYGGWTFKAPFGTVDNYTVVRSAGYALYYYGDYSQDTIIRASTFQDNGATSFYMAACSGWTLTLVDCEVDSWTFNWAAGGTCNRSYSFNVLVTDAEGTAQSGVTVTLRDKDSTELFSLNTGADGKLSSAQDVIYAIYTTAGGNTPDLQGPHTLTITDGTNTVETKITIDHKIEDDQYALGASGISTYDDIMEALTKGTSAAVVDDASNSATTFETNLTQAANDYYNDGVLVFSSGNCKGETKRISDYDGGTKFITVDSALSEKPAAGDTFNIAAGLSASDISEGVWEYTTRRLSDAVLSGGGQLATTTETDAIKTDTESILTDTGLIKGYTDEV